MIVQKLRGARQRIKAKEGRCEGRKPYGYREQEQPILARMQALRSSGMGVDAIAGTLNNEGLMARSGGPWYGSGVNRILKASSAA
jgi:hypothetical protein